MSAKNIECKVHKRFFATKKAYEQHVKDSHTKPSQGPKTGGRDTVRNSKQPAQAKAGKSFGKGQLVVSGTDLIGNVTIGDTDQPGKLLLAWDISPLTMPNTRLYHLAQTFARWRPRKITFSAVPGMGVFTPGSYAMGWVADPTFSLGDTGTRLARILTLSPSDLATFGSPRTLKIPMRTTQKWYFCESGDERETTHGMILVVLAALVGAKNLSINFKIDWTVEFDSAEIPASVTAVEIYPDPEYLPVFTDSVSDWASGEKLTFKHKEGGSVVPWLGVRSDMIYRPASGVRIPYYDKDSKVQECKYFAAIGGIYPSGLACFASEDDAKAFVKNKDTSKVLTYYKAGEYTTPVLPTLIGTEASAISLDLRLSTLRIKDQQARSVRAGAEAQLVNIVTRGMQQNPRLNMDHRALSKVSVISRRDNQPAFRAGWGAPSPSIGVDVRYRRGSDPGPSVEPGEESSFDGSVIDSGEC